MAGRRGKAESLGALLPGRLPPAVLMAMAIADLVKEWESVTGSTLGRKSRPVSIERNVLVVVCETPSVAKMLTMKGGTIARQIEKGWRLGITGIRVVVGRIEDKREPEEPGNHRIEPSPESIRACLSYTGEKIDRKDVAEALAGLMATYMKRFPGRGKN